MKEYLESVRRQAPLIHNITNYVTANDVANVLLAVGASPIMADEPDEASEITSHCRGLHINLGTLHLRTIQAMLLAGRKAQELGHAILLDPVGVGASSLRRDTAISLMEEIRFDVIRGNVSELKALAGGTASTGGVDADAADAVTEENLDRMTAFAKRYSAACHAIVAITGAIDLVADEDRCFVIRNGCPEMSRVTGTGCQLSGLMTAFVSANPDHKLEASAAAVILMGLAGEIGVRHLQPGEGNATLRTRMIDAIYNMTGERLEREANYDIR